MKFIKRFIFMFGGLFVILLLVFKSLILQNSAVWGDAPYFYPEGLQELWTFPNVWVNRNHNFGGVELSLWLAPLMFLYGSLHKFLSFNNDTIIRLLFYFPALVFSVISPVVFVRFLKLSKVVQFFASLLYLTNTYFLLLIDGGQVGVALAYSIFPLSLTFLLKLFDKPSVNNFFLALLFYFVLQVADVRIALISIFAAVLWIFIVGMLNKSLSAVKNLWLLAPFATALLGLSSYWLLPLMKVNDGIQVFAAINSQSTIFDSLTLFQPHWPMNQFGKVSAPPLYFVVIPFLVLCGLFFRKMEKKYWAAIVCFLIFAFLAKGNSKPLGGIYEWTVINIPFGTGFRDSTKFFTPLALFAGILLGLSVDGISDWIKNKFLRPGVAIGVAVFLLMIIKPVWNGELNGVLSGKQMDVRFDAIYQKLSKEEGSFRTVWFPEKSPFSFQTEAKPALDAKLLVQNRPFASLNTGNDPYNFFSKDDWSDFFKLLGIKYLVLSGDPRAADLTEDKKELRRVQNFITSTPGVKKVEWDVPFPIYQIDEVRPKIFATNKLLVIIGSDDIYQKFVSSPIANQSFLFLEDGKSNPAFLDYIASESATLIFNNSDENDFFLSFLQKYFTSLKNVKESQWATRESVDYLSWKYELLQKGVKTQDFDYGKGIQFSTVPNEKTTVTVNAPKDGQYMLAVRSMSGGTRSPLRIGFNNEVLDILYKASDKFEWYLKGPLQLDKGNHDLFLENTDGIHIFNTTALIPIEDWRKTRDALKDITTKFEVVTIDGSESAGDLIKLVVNNKWTKVDYTAESPVRYLIKTEAGYPWIVFTDNFDGNWKLKNKSEYISSLPFYSMLNGFYMSKPSDKLEIVFKGQEQIRWGIYYSALSVLGLLMVFLYMKGKKV